MQKPGAVVFDNLSLLFAIGIGFGLSDDFRGEAALAAAVAFLGLQAITGPGALAELFYSKTMLYDVDSVKNVIDPITKIYDEMSVPIANLTSGGLMTLDDGSGQMIYYNGLLDMESGYFAGKTSLLYFVKG